MVTAVGFKTDFEVATSQKAIGPSAGQGARCVVSCSNRNDKKTDRKEVFSAAAQPGKPGLTARELKKRQRAANYRRLGNSPQNGGFKDVSSALIQAGKLLAHAGREFKVIASQQARINSHTEERLAKLELEKSRAPTGLDPSAPSFEPCVPTTLEQRADAAPSLKESRAEAQPLGSPRLESVVPCDQSAPRTSGVDTVQQVCEPLVQNEAQLQDNVLSQQNVLASGSDAHTHAEAHTHESTHARTHAQTHTRTNAQTHTHHRRMLLSGFLGKYNALNAEM